MYFFSNLAKNCVIQIVIIRITNKIILLFLECDKNEGNILLLVLSQNYPSFNSPFLCSNPKSIKRKRLLIENIFETLRTIPSVKCLAKKNKFDFIDL